MNTHGAIILHNVDVQLIHREVITHSQLHHPNIVPLLGVFCETAVGPPMMVLPFAEKGSLSDLVREELIQGVRFAKIVRCILHYSRTRLNNAVSSTSVSELAVV